MTVVPIACQSEGALEVFIEPVQPAPRLVIVGRSPMAQTLADLAGALGWRTALIGSREFSTADADGHSMVVVATQGHGDEEVMEQAVAARPAYLGLVASQRRGAAVLGYLKDRGVPKDRLDRIKVPAGLNLGRTSHREIAVAILAELVQLRAAGEIGGGTGGAGVTSTGAGEATGAHAGHAERAAPAAGQRAASAPAVAAPAEAVDPVCGMTVVADDSSYPLVHDGVTYYFCRVGCRRAFEADPAAYVKKGTRC
jgi:xanthine dehydrogenase accessory factor